MYLHIRAGCAIVAVSLGGGVEGAIRLEAIDTLEFSFAVGLGISGDGNTVVGSLGAPQTAFRWSAATSETLRIVLPASFTQPLAHVCSYDGSTIGVSNGTVATYRFRNVLSPGRDDNLRPLGGSGDVRFCSDDGEVLAGGSGSGGWRWSSAVGLETFSNFTVWSATPNGVVLAGQSSSQAAVRDATGTVRLLPIPSGATGMGIADEISANAVIVAGTVGTQCYRWVNDVPSLIPTVPGLAVSAMRVQGMSDSGDVILGSFGTTSGGRGIWLWTPALGTVNLRTYLQSRGVNVGGFAFIDGVDISSDGLAILGSYGAAGAFYLRFDTLPIPAPSAAIPCVLGLGLMASRRRR